MTEDPWLDRWLPTIEARARTGRVLEVGCGAGHDTETLLRAGLRVVAFDIAAEQVQAARLRAPGAEIHCQSVLDRFPLEGTGVPVIVASLSLHYFPWAQTMQLFDRLRQTLAADGLLLCRLNSTDDHHFGASGHAEIERHYYRVRGQPKRFFDREDLDALFAAGWRIVSIQHAHTGKYVATKALWEVAAERAA
ncbi:MAG: class I SAM-dependent methyltransferase [Burkholderiales bacterium]|nr:class I SAM-dependent methyltransferase [Burkholderiales bacterium]